MTAAKGFFDARDLLLRHRTDYGRAYREFAWPALGEFNWALDYFDVIARNNDNPALWIVDDPASEGFRTKALSTKAELLSTLESGLASARLSLAATTDQHLLTPWAFKMNGRVVQPQPRYIMIADAVFSHLDHHRGQLTIYLRLTESKVPALYGPSADEFF